MKFLFFPLVWKFPKKCRDKICFGGDNYMIFSQFLKGKPNVVLEEQWTLNTLAAKQNCIATANTASCVYGGIHTFPGRRLLSPWDLHLCDLTNHFLFMCDHYHPLGDHIHPLDASDWLSLILTIIHTTVCFSRINLHRCSVLSSSANLLEFNNIFSGSLSWYLLYEASIVPNNIDCNR